MSISRIQLLPESVVNKIAAGEVIERPASVVKELLENSLDAGATRITVDLRETGRGLIQVTDDGHGMTSDECLLALERHATSKIRNENDLLTVTSLGFRGEALPSIFAVSRLTLRSKVPGSSTGTLVEGEGGKVTKAIEADGPQGTTVRIQDLFFNTPARLKFLKSPQTEMSAILRVATRLAMTNLGLHLRLTHNGKGVISAPPARDLRDRVGALYGDNVAGRLLTVEAEKGRIQLVGLTSPPHLSRGHREEIQFFVNGRPVRDPILTQALLEAYRPLLHREQFPLAFLFLTVPPGEVDVNVHPTKGWVRFHHPRLLSVLVTESVQARLRSGEAAPPRRVPNAPGMPPVPALIEAGAGDVGQGRLFHEPEAAYGEALTFGRPLGQVQDTYIVAYTDEEVFFVDQHVAHERVLFERLQREVESSGLPSQALLFPQPVELAPARLKLLEAWIPFLARLGFAVEPFGAGRLLLRAVPSLLRHEDPHRLLDDLAKDLGPLEKHPASPGVDRILSFVACHAAIKKNHPLEREEMGQLLQDLAVTASPFFCPHGRPIVSRISLREIKRDLRRE